MQAVFLKIVNMGMTAGWLILAVILVRLFLKKAPRWIVCALWALVAIRLICPFSPKSALSLIPKTEWIAETPQVQELTPPSVIDSEAISAPQPGTEVIIHTQSPAVTIEKHLNFSFFLPYLWLAGMAALLLYALVSYLRLKRSVGASLPVRDNILACDEVQSPFILGIFRPKIYIPSSMDCEALELVIAHETAHIRRRDHWWKPLGYLLLSVYWFHPLCWLAYVLLCRDIELACDEKAIQNMDSRQMAAYSQTLLDCSFPRRKIAACPLAFGEVGVKERVRSVLSYKKPAFWIIAAAVVTCVVVAICFGTDPVGTDFTEYNYEDIQPSSEIFTDYKGVYVTFSSWEPDKDGHISFQIKWHNDTKEEITYGKCYAIERKEGNAWITAADREVIFNMIGYTLRPHSRAAMSYAAAPFDLSQKGTYRLIVPFSVYDGKEYQSYSTWVEFQINREAGVDESSPAAVLPWFDCLHGDDMIWDGIREINLDEYPGVTFRCHAEKLEAVTDKETVTLYTGMPIWSVYFCDLNGDGKRELCSSASLGSGIVDDRIAVYDYANRAFYELQGRNEGYDYTLNMMYGELRAERRLRHDSSEAFDTGYLLLQPVAGANGGSVLQLTMAPSVPAQGGADLPTGSFESTVSFANWTDRSDIYLKARNREQMNISHIQHLPIYKFDTLQELEQFKKDFDGILAMDAGMDEVPSFNAATAKYDRAFFEENTLLLVYVGANNCTHRFKVHSIGWDEAHIEVHITETTHAESVAMAMAGWFVTIAVSDERIRNVTQFDADLDNGIELLKKEQGISWPDIDTAISAILQEKYQSQDPDGFLHVQTYRKLFDEVIGGNGETVYLLVYHAVYSPDTSLAGKDGPFLLIDHGFVPTAITFSATLNGGCTLQEYWVPNENGNREAQVRAKFPGASAEEALHTERYEDDLIEESIRQATEFLKAFGVPSD